MRDMEQALADQIKRTEEVIKEKRVLIDNSLKFMEELDVEYIEFVDMKTFEFQEEIDENTLMLIAARTPETNTRLIDNLALYV